MNRTINPALVLAVFVAGVALPACPSSADLCDDGACDPVGGSADGGDGNVIVPAGCDLTKSPNDSPECVSDNLGVFVSPTGKDGAAGTKAEPLRSVTEAASRGKPRVYICEGTYDAPISISQAVSLYGGFTCAWGISENRPRVAPSKGIALRVTGVSGAVTVENVEIAGSADAIVPGDSAIAAFVSGSSNVTFRGVMLIAGPGTAGAGGESRSNYTGATATKGGNANAANGGVGPTCNCDDGTTSSRGGNGAPGNGVASRGSAEPSVGISNGGSSAGTTCTDGSVGTKGAPNGAGTASTSAGTLSAEGWSAASIPTVAPNGNPGQGGGGGGAKTDSNNAGGAGGCGGCGGAGGTQGLNGGSSFALLSFNSTVAIEGGGLVSGVGGRGGKGGEGQAGQTGGPVGSGVCDGGPGGNGAGGSGGGGGAGGHSLPVGFVGPEPRMTGASLTPGPKGIGGDGGAAGKGPGNHGTIGSSGSDGKAERSLPLQ
jgi:hypothetical protein